VSSSYKNQASTSTQAEPLFNNQKKDGVGGLRGAELSAGAWLTLIALLQPMSRLEKKKIMDRCFFSTCTPN